jgi:DNA-binding CsgD family transcriptional regulator
MNATRMALPEIVDGLINLAGISTQEAAVRSGVSPGTVAALRVRAPTQVVTWCRMASALGCRLSVVGGGRVLPVDMPRPSPPQVMRAWDGWRQRRLISARHSVAALKERLKGAAREARAQDYVTNEETRLRARIEGLRTAIPTQGGQHRADGLREAVRLVAQTLAITAEELSLLAGVHLAAAQHALGEENDGRLVTLHRLLSALDVRLRLDLPAKGAIDLRPVAPGPWVPGAKDDDETPRAAASADADDGEAVTVAQPTTNRSRIDAERILALYDAGHSIGEIARMAGISRQRVHRIAMDNGRRPRRELAREQRIAAGQDIFGS